MKPIIQCDFDGTIVTNNISLLLRERFAHKRWRAIESEYVAGKISVEESNRRQFRLIRESEEVLGTFARQHAVVRPGFEDFVRYCQSSGARLVLVSSGLDFYIESALTSLSLPRIEVLCARTVFQPDGVLVEYFDPGGAPVRDGFKLRCLKSLRKQGSPIVYIGDGLSDVEPARNADCVFATGSLRGLLSAASIHCYHFSSFEQITSALAPAITAISASECYIGSSHIGHESSCLGERLTRSTPAFLGIGPSRSQSLILGPTKKPEK